MQGVAVRLYARDDRGGTIYREVRLGGGAKDRQSLHTRDRVHASSPRRARGRTPQARGARVADLSQHRVDAYGAARRSGAIASPRHRTPEPGARAGTIRNELQLLATMLRWARQHRIDGRPLLVENPLEGVTFPRELNTRRPVTTQARYEATRAQAAAVDPRGRFACLLALARHTGRRINALINLRASDVLRTRAHVEAALGALGQPVGAAAHWPCGALRFRAAFDKRQYDAVVPINAAARDALYVNLRDHPRLGEAPLVPATTDDAAAAHKTLAGYWLRRAERRAALPPLDRRAWHAFRRL